jgi:hypothetical protein
VGLKMRYLCSLLSRVVLCAVRRQDVGRNSRVCLSITPPPHISCMFHTEGVHTNKEGKGVAIDWGNFDVMEWSK